MSGPLGPHCIAIKQAWGPPRAEPQAGSRAACSLLVSLHGWPAPQPPCIVSERLLECGRSVHLLRPVLLTVLLCARLNLGKNPEFLDCSKERKNGRNSSFHLGAGPESCSVSPRPALPLGLWAQTVGRTLGLWAQTVGRPRDCRGRAGSWRGAGYKSDMTEQLSKHTLPRQLLRHTS